MASALSPIPVTVLTGFLGSGKTTLLNRILTEQHGKRIAVIENEFGEIGIDHELVINADEEIFEMNNGCICCTVRGDLIRILGNLVKRRDKFDYILIETTGLADPGPVAQTFFVDDEMRDSLRLDGIVTLVDAKHIVHHLDDSEEIKAQIAFADVILLNKVDLVTEAELKQVEARLRAMNGACAIHHTRDASIDLGRVLDVGGFDLEHAMEIDPRFMEPEYPFEWVGVYDLQPGRYDLVLQEGPDDPKMDVAWVRVDAAGTPIDQDLLNRSIPLGESAFAKRFAPQHYTSEHGIVAGDILHRLPLTPGMGERIRPHARAQSEMVYAITVDHPGVYALFTEHHPDEFDLAIDGPESCVAPVLAREFKPPHEHEDDVTSVGINMVGDLHLERFNRWLSDLLRTQGPDIYRMKGVLSIDGFAEKYVFQGVHMLFTGQLGQPWDNDARTNQLIFIGRNLDRDALTAEFQACIV